jgi:hypothetical protein
VGTWLFIAVTLQQLGIMFTMAGNAGFITGLYVVLTPILWYHSSEKVYCDPCLYKPKDGMRTHYHSMLGVTIVKSGSGVVLSVIARDDTERRQGREAGV